MSSASRPVHAGAHKVMNRSESPARTLMFSGARRAGRLRLSGQRQDRRVAWRRGERARLQARHGRSLVGWRGRVGSGVTPAGPNSAWSRRGSAGSMGQALGDVLPLAVAIAIFPVPIIAVVLIVGSDRGRAKGLAFVLAWCVGLAAVGAIVLLVGGVCGRERRRQARHLGERVAAQPRPAASGGGGQAVARPSKRRRRDTDAGLDAHDG